jgi:hypothetical protein
VQDPATTSPHLESFIKIRSRWTSANVTGEMERDDNDDTDEVMSKVRNAGIFAQAFRESSVLLLKHQNSVMAFWLFPTISLTQLHSVCSVHSQYMEGLGSLIRYTLTA